MLNHEIFQANNRRVHGTRSDNTERIRDPESPDGFPCLSGQEYRTG